jgi:yecA family protein
MQPAIKIDYQGLTDRLGVSVLDASAAEAHGILCGLICAGVAEAEKRWLGELLDAAEPQDLLVREATESLSALARSTRQEIGGPGVGFTPLLPSDEQPLPERAVALYDWVRGFLYGVGVSALDPSRLSNESREILDDLVAITRMDLDSLSEGEENENALMELQEFIPVAAMLLYEERGRSEDRQ